MDDEIDKLRAELEETKKELAKAKVFFFFFFFFFLFVKSCC